MRARKRGRGTRSVALQAIAEGIAQALDQGLTKPHDLALAALASLEGAGIDVRRKRGTANE